MSSEIKLLTPVVPTEEPTPNFVNAIGDSTFSNFSQTASGSINSVAVDSVVKGGVAKAVGSFDNLFTNDPTFASLFTDILGVGVDSPYQGASKIESKILASFDVAAKTTFSFDFSANLEQTAKEIENTDAEYNLAESKVGFLVIDNSRDMPKVIDYFGIKGELITSDPTGSLKLGSSERVTIVDDLKETDIDGNNGTDSLVRNVVGNYERKFKKAKNIIVAKINESEIKFTGDTLIGKLGEDVIYGSIRKDRIKGTHGNDKIYASLGNDKLIGNNGDDILEGGQGNDKLKGGKGNDKLHGGEGDDTIIGGSGSDVLLGGNGSDEFIFHLNNFKQNEFDVIEDFQLGSDKIVFKKWGNFNFDDWLNDMFTLGNVTDTDDGVLLNFEDGKHQGLLLLNDLTSDQINTSVFRDSTNV